MIKFFRCSHCGNIITKVKDAGVPVMCCGQMMDELVPNTSDGAGEKHVPAVAVEGCDITVKVGEVEHPMLEEHYIQWIFVETENGGQLRYLQPGAAPEAGFCTGFDKAVAVYEYCNLHGLWKKEL